MNRSENTKPISKNVKFHDFKTIKEPWNIYIMEDKSKLKVKIILVNIGMEKSLEDLANEQEKVGKPVSSGVFLNITKVLGIEADPSYYGTPGKPIPSEELRKHIVEEDIEINERKESWNEYHIDNGIILKTKHNLINV